MPFLTAADLRTRIHEEIVDEITRDDNTIVVEAIAAAIAEMKAHLGQYDVLQLFGDDVTEPTVNDAYLKNMAKDIVCWQLIKLGNPCTDYEHTKACYEWARKDLKAIQAGQNTPDWPYRETTGETAPQGNSVAASYTRKRQNDF